MMAIDDSFDKQFFNSFLGRKFSRIKNEMDITFEELSNRLGVSQSYITNMFNGRQVASSERWMSVATALGLSEKEFKEIYNEARILELKNSTGIEINALDDIDFDVMLSREYGITDEQSIRDIKKYIDFIKTK